jgi:hypothetical protein
METANLILALIATWATIGLALYLWDVLKMALAWMVLVERGTPRRKALMLALIAIEAAAAGPLYTILRTGFFKRSNP